MRGGAEAKGQGGMKYSVVPRPWLTKNRTGLYDALYDAVEHTAVNGNAVEVVLNGRTAKAIRDTLRCHLAKRGLWLRSPRFGNTLRVWAEEKRQVGPARGQEAKMRKVTLMLLGLLILASPAWAVNFEFDWPQTNADATNLTDLAGARVYVCPATPCTKANGVKTGADIAAPALDPLAGAVGTFSITTGKGVAFVTAFDTTGNEGAGSNVLPFDAVAPAPPTLRQVP